MRAKGIGINADAARLDVRLDRLRADLDSFAAAGFEYVEIPAHGVGVIRHGALDRARLAAVRRCLAGFDFGYSVHGPNPLDLMDAERPDWQARAMEASLDFAAEVGAGVLVYHAGRFLAEERFYLPGACLPGEAERGRMLAREREALAALGDLAAARGVTLTVENARPYLEAPGYCYAERLEALAGQIRAVGHPAVRIALDVGHAGIAAGIHGFDLAAAVRDLADLVAHVHLHDNFGLACTSLERKQPELLATGRGDLHLPPGEGNLPLDEVILALPEYEGILLLEMRPRYWDDLAGVRRRTAARLAALGESDAEGEGGVAGRKVSGPA